MSQPEQQPDPQEGGRYLRDPETGALTPIDEDGNPKLKEDPADAA